MILLVSVSARMLAELAVREGHDVSRSTVSATSTCSALCPSVSILRDLGGRGGMAELVRGGRARSRAERVVYGAGLENRPDLVARLAGGRTLLGCAPDDAARACAIRPCSARRCAPRGSRTRARSPPRGAGTADRARRWLRKPLRGGGGRGVRDVARRAADRRRRRPGAHRRPAVLGGCGRRRTLRGAARRERAADRAPRARRPRLRVVRATSSPPRLPAAERRALADAAAGDLRAPRRRVRPARRVRRGRRLGRRAGVGGGGQPAPGRVARDDRRRARRPLVRRAPGGVRRAPAARRTPLPSRTARRGGQGGALRDRGRCASRTRATGRPAGSATSRIRARRSRPASRSARSSRRGARREAVLADLEARAAALRASSTRWASMPSPDAPAPATCGGCGLVCDDITAVVGDDGGLERLSRTCPLGDAWFAERLAPAPPARARRRPRGRARRRARRGGGDPRRARARRSCTGWARTTCEAQRAAVALAEAIGAMIDPAGPLLDGASGLAFQARGASTATLGEVRDRADVVVVWRADPVATHPRLLERLRLPGRGPRARRRRRAADGDRGAGRHVPRAARRTATSRRCGRCARSSARRRSAPARRRARSTTSPRGCAAAPQRRDPASRARVRRGARAARARPRPVPGHARRRRDAPPRGQRRRRRGRARLADGLPGGGELRERATRGRTRAS